MKEAIPIACGYSLLTALAGFLFGQLFFGQLEVGATLAGSGGALAAVAGSKLSSGARTWAIIAIIAAFFALIGVVIDATNYYIHLNIPGNNYAWIFIGPFCVAQVLIAYSAWNNVSRTKQLRQ